MKYIERIVREEIVNNIPFSESDRFEMNIVSKLIEIKPIKTSKIYKWFHKGNPDKIEYRFISSISSVNDKWRGKCYKYKDFIEEFPIYKEEGNSININNEYFFEPNNIYPINDYHVDVVLLDDRVITLLEKIK